MAGLLIIAHAPLASALKVAAGHAFPEAAASVEALDVPPQQSQELTESQARAKLATVLALPGRREALIFTDVFGATPANVAQRLADGVFVKVVTGVNVPMLWRALNYADEPLERLVARALSGAVQGVMQVASVRPQNQSLNTTAQGGHDLDARHHQQ